jgi:hypothetical protein
MFFKYSGPLKAILATWPAYLVKLLSVDGFICFGKLKIRVALPNRVRSVWALIPKLLRASRQLVGQHQTSSVNNLLRVAV